MEQNRYFGRVVPMGDPTAAFSLTEPAPAAAIRCADRAGTDEEEAQAVRGRHQEDWNSLGRS